MKVLSRAALIAFALFACALPAQALAAGTGLDAYDVKASPKVLKSLGQRGFDVTEARHGNHIEIVATRGQAAALARDGITAKLKRDRQGRTVRQRFDALAHPDGSLRRLPPVLGQRPTSATRTRTTTRARCARRSTRSCSRSRPRTPTSSSRETIGHTINGVPILALKVTNNARTTPDGQRPAILYSSNQHAREWITAESDRRLAHLFVDNYSNANDTSLAKDHNGDDISGEAAA